MNGLRKLMMLVALLLIATPLLSAQNSTAESTQKQVTALVEKYQKEKGVMAVSGEDGVMLQTLKMMLRKEFGKEFTNAIKAFALISYQEASPECASKINDEIAQITAPLQQIDVAKKMTKGEEASGYIRLSEDGKKVSDLLIVITSPTPVLIYFSGEFDAETAPQVQ